MILCDTNILIEFYRGNSDIVQELQKIGLPTAMGFWFVLWLFDTRPAICLAGQ